MTDRNNQQYVLDCLKKAVHALATGPGDLRSRLISAYYGIVPVRLRDLLENLREDLLWIRSKLTKREPTAIEIQFRMSQPEATLKHMQIRTAVPVAARIINLCILG